MANVFTKLRNNIFDPVAPPQELAQRYGTGASTGYQLSGGTTNRIPQLVQGFLQKRNLPGQVVAGAAVRSQQSNPIWQVKQKMQQGQPLSPQESNLITDQSLKVAGVMTPLAQSRLSPRFKFGRLVRNVESRDPRVGMAAHEELQEMVTKNLPKRMVGKINKTNNPGSARTSAFIDALDYRLPNVPKSPPMSQPKRFPRRLEL